jgi:hypothetical protein
MRFRLLRRVGGIALAALVRWRVAIQDIPPPAPDGADFDLRAPPAEVVNRVWANLRRKSFRFSVFLPDERMFSVESDIASAFGSQLLIKLPMTDLDGALRLLAEYVREWQFDPAEVAEWAERAAVVTTAGHVYGTRVFRAPPIGFVRLELQVEHHVEQDGYVIDVLFSWPAGPGAQARPA